MKKKDHWEQVYEKQAANKLGWFEENPDPSLELIETCRLGRDDSMLHVGAGATTLVDILLKKGMRRSWPMTLVHQPWKSLRPV